MKGAQPRPTLITPRPVGASPSNDVWMRAMVLAPNSYRFMSATVIGEADMTADARPFRQAGGDRSRAASPKMRRSGFVSDRFTGSAFATLPEVSFGMQTAALR